MIEKRLRRDGFLPEPPSFEYRAPSEEAISITEEGFGKAGIDEETEAMRQEPLCQAFP